MGSWIAERAKMFAALVVPPIVVAIIAGLEGVTGFTIPEDAKAWVIGTIATLVGGAAVYQIPNKPPSQ